ncbi:oxidoreductase [Aphelenchoides avenae]|nr:oxidoreductase [Aphelenchus avenae]
MKPASIPVVKMSNGINLPLLGLGTWLSNSPDELKTALHAALDAGYRLIDTAYLYFNEVIIGEALQEYFKTGKLKREDVFITSKLSPTYHKPSDVGKSVEKQLKDLRTDYIDLYLIHNPCPCKKDANKDYLALDAKNEVVPEPIPHIDTWRALEALYKQGKLRALGVSNFNERQLRALYKEAEIKPHNLQVECHILWPQNELFQACKELGITFTAYSPIGSPGGQQAMKSISGDWPQGDCLNNLKVQELAKKYGKTPAQILLRYMVQRGISVIPKSTNPNRVRENINIFDFELTPEDARKLETITERQRIFPAMYGINHPWYPYDDVLEHLGVKRNEWTDIKA